MSRGRCEEEAKREGGDMERVGKAGGESRGEWITPEKSREQ